MESDSTSMPLRLFSVENWLNKNTILFKPAEDWNFCIVSHVWGSFCAWKTQCNTYDKVIKVTAFSRTNLTRAAHCIRKLGFEWSWIDTICIDQNSIIEKQREIKNMGDYYTNAKQCLVFTGGLHNIGHLLYDDYSVPFWHSRVWTLQEAVLSKNAVYLYKVDNIQTIKNSTKLNKYYNRSITISNEWVYKKHTYFVVPHGSIEEAIESALDIISETTKKEFTLSKGKIVGNVLTHIKTNDWTLQNVLRECGRRKCTKEEDIVYGVLGLLKISDVDIQYNIGKCHAMLNLANKLPDNKTALLMTCDFTHNAIPDFSSTSSRYAAWGLNVEYCIATAHILDDCIRVETKCTSVLLERNEANSPISTDKTNKPSSSLGKITVNKFAENVDCFGIMLGFKNNIQKQYTLMLIGHTQEKWATENLKADKVGICVVVNADTEPKTRKEGLVIIDSSKLKWNTKKISVFLYPELSLTST